MEKTCFILAYLTSQGRVPLLGLNDVIAGVLRGWPSRKVGWLLLQTFYQCRLAANANTGQVELLQLEKLLSLHSHQSYGKSGDAFRVVNEYCARKCFCSFVSLFSVCYYPRVEIVRSLFQASRNGWSGSWSWWDTFEMLPTVQPPSHVETPNWYVPEPCWQTAVWCFQSCRCVTWHRWLKTLCFYMFQHVGES